MKAEATFARQTFVGRFVSIAPPDHGESISTFYGQAFVCVCVLPRDIILVLASLWRLLRLISSRKIFIKRFSLLGQNTHNAVRTVLFYLFSQCYYRSLSHKLIEFCIRIRTFKRGLNMRRMRNRRKKSIIPMFVVARARNLLSDPTRQITPI